MFTLPPFMQNALPTALPYAMPTAFPPVLPAEWPGKLATALAAAWPAALPARLPAGTPAELLDATRNLAESQLAGCNALMQAAFTSSASLLDVNVHATRDSLAAANTASNQLMFVREVRDLVCLTASQSQQALERAQRYGRQVAGVAHQAQHRLGELSRDFAGSLPRNPIE